VILPVIAFPAIDPVALHLGPISIRWYGLAYVAAFVVAGLVMHWLVDRWKLNISDDDQLTIVIAAVIGVIVGGRLGYVLVYGGGFFLSNPLRIFAIWDGGMSFHGGLAGAAFAIWLFARKNRVSALSVADICAAVVPIGLLLGRLANFIKPELWGRPSDVPWAMVFPDAGNVARHPSQLYEAGLEGLVLLIVLGLFVRAGALRRPGLVAGLFGVGYGIARIICEFFREPDPQLGFLFGNATMGMLLSLPLILVGLGLITMARSIGGEKT